MKHLLLGAAYTLAAICAGVVFTLFVMFWGDVVLALLR